MLPQQTPPEAPATLPEGGDQSAQGGYTVCIKVAPDDSMSVGVETDAQEAAEDGSESEDSAYQPAKSLKDALTIAMKIIQNKGEATPDTADADFQSGFGGPATSGDMQ